MLKAVNDFRVAYSQPALQYNASLQNAAADRLQKAKSCDAYNAAPGVVNGSYALNWQVSGRPDYYSTSYK